MGAYDSKSKVHKQTSGSDSPARTAAMVGKSISRYEIIEKLGEGGMGVDGQPRRLTPAPSDENVPNWSRDGMWVYFASNRSGR